MRAMLPILLHDSLIRNEKQIVWCAFLANQIYIASILKECGIDAKFLHSKRNNEQGNALITEFISSNK